MGDVQLVLIAKTCRELVNRGPGNLVLLFIFLLKHILFTIGQELFLCILFLLPVVSHKLVCGAWALLTIVFIRIFKVLFAVNGHSFI